MLTFIKVSYILIHTDMTICIMRMNIQKRLRETIHMNMLMLKHLMSMSIFQTPTIDTHINVCDQVLVWSILQLR